MSRRQSNKWAAQDQQQYYQQQPQYQQPAAQYQQQPQYYQQPAAAPAAPPAAQPNSVQQLKDLADLKAQGVLTDQEFTEAKARILSA